MMASVDGALLPLNARQNDDPWSMNLEVTDTETGMLVDMTGYTVIMQVRAYEGATGTPLIDARTGDAGVSAITTETTGFNIEIGMADLQALPMGGEVGSPTIFYYDIWVQDTGGAGSVWYYGPFTVRAGVVRP